MCLSSEYWGSSPSSCGAELQVAPAFSTEDVEFLLNIAPVLADALAQAKIVTMAGSGGGGAAESVGGNISSVIQTVLASQRVTRGGLLGETDDGQKT